MARSNSRRILGTENVTAITALGLQFDPDDCKVTSLARIES